MQVELNSLLLSALIEIVCVFVFSEIECRVKVLIHARPLSVS